MYLPIRRIWPLTAVLVAAIFAVACSNDSTTTTPTTTTPASVSDTFTGIVNPNGAATFPFAVPVPGTVIATLTSLSPGSTLVIGFALGTWNGTSCQLILAADRATTGTVIQGSVSGAGNLCVRLYDVGNLSSSQSFQIDVTHP